MICSKERDKNNRFEKSCMQWTELAAIGYTTTPRKLIFFSDKYYLYGEKKIIINHELDIYLYLCIDY